MKNAMLTSAMGAVIALGMTAGQEAKADYPEQPIEMIVAWAAGGSTDLYARAVAPKLAEVLGTDVVVRNVTGAAGTIGTAEFTQADPDGYTILHTPAGPVSTQPHMRNTPYGPDDMKPICRVVAQPLAIMVPEDSEFDSIEDLVAAAEADPDALNYGSTGAGTYTHISMIGLAQAADINLTHVPYEGSAPALRALIGGEVDVFSEQINVVPRYDLKALAVWADERTEDRPDVPTMRELGYEMSFYNWNAWFAPADTPDEIVEVLAEACNDVVNDPEVIQALEVDQETPIAYLNPEELGAFYAEQFEIARNLIESAGLSAQ